MLLDGSRDNEEKIFKQFYTQLVKTLPMDDAIFISELYSRDLLPGDLKNELKAERTSAKKVSYFLDNVIEPSVTSSHGNRFDDLLNVMEDSEYQVVKELAKLIRTSVRETCRGRNSENG